MQTDPPNRCRLVLVVPPIENAEVQLEAAIGGGDIASIILPRGEMDEAAYHRHAEKLTELTSGLDMAVLVERDSQIMGRSGADGLFIPSGLEELKDAIARFSPKRLVGYGGALNRHHVMEAAECYPDFIFLGKLDGDIKAEAHPRNVTLAQWASEVMQTSIVVMGGSSLESVVEVARSGADFVALGLAIFSHLEGPQAAVIEANRLLDAHGPIFEDDQ